MLKYSLTLLWRYANISYLLDVPSNSLGIKLLRLEEADSGQITLFFTDYTPHPLRSVEGYYGQWGMHASTSRIDPTILDIMKPGQYWTIRNMRLKHGSMNFLEADLYDARFCEVIDEEDDIHLSDLLMYVYRTSQWLHLFTYCFS